MTLDPKSTIIMRGVDVRRTRGWHNERAGELYELRRRLDALTQTVQDRTKTPGIATHGRPHPWRVTWAAPDDSDSGSGDPIQRVLIDDGSGNEIPGGVYWWQHYPVESSGAGWYRIADLSPYGGLDGDGLLPVEPPCFIVATLTRTAGHYVDGGAVLFGDSFALAFSTITSLGSLPYAWDEHPRVIALIDADGRINQYLHDDFYMREDPAPFTLQLHDPDIAIPDGWEDATTDYPGYPLIGTGSAATYEPGATTLPTVNFKLIRKL